MKHAFWLGGLLVLPALQAGACDLKTGLVPFETDAAAISRPAPEDALEAPEVELVGAVRGVGGAAGSCDASGMLILRLRAPDGDYEPAELGYEFRAVQAQPSYPMLPATPVAISAEAKRDEVVLLWTDAAPAQQQPLQLHIEVRALTRDGQFGPAATLIVDTRDPAVVEAERKRLREEEKERERLAEEQEEERRRLEKEQEKERKRLQREQEDAS